jgi:hypothetical protein
MPCCVAGRFGSAILAAGEGELGGAVSHEGTSSCGQGYIPGTSLQLLGTPDRMEVFHVPHLSVSTHSVTNFYA